MRYIKKQILLITTAGTIEYVDCMHLQSSTCDACLPTFVMSHHLLLPFSLFGPSL